MRRTGTSRLTQKPIALMEWCLDRAPKAKSILDPFMGSGTTGVACVNLAPPQVHRRDRARVSLNTTTSRGGG